jgi:hypothetical protein
MRYSPCHLGHDVLILVSFNFEFLRRSSSSAQERKEVANTKQSKSSPPENGWAVPAASTRQKREMGKEAPTRKIEGKVGLCRAASTRQNRKRGNEAPTRQKIWKDWAVPAASTRQNRERGKEAPTKQKIGKDWAVPAAKRQSRGCCQLQIERRPKPRAGSS